ncbi:hypothetical protein PtA15_5A492 [Puccinia triticina]|uniref:Uncharacterized protein n=1 Tax=Puccinia triticina TaxID=208348 RepID=A0ABY7CII3_9BASI|nr:uncharacterized protein PtA15_5A492 [Puccinia triticina]WAQ84919.1 hypothetical protein PtA15_5A492 [Puccinia triticina]
MGCVHASGHGEHVCKHDEHAAERTPEPPPQALPTSAPSTPLADTSTLDDFFRYAHVRIDQVEEALNKLGITHWSMFKCYEVKELANSEFPDAPAPSFFLCGVFLQSLILCNHATSF